MVITHLFGRCIFGSNPNGTAKKMKKVLDNSKKINYYISCD